jgi:hypothetical protein
MKNKRNLWLAVLPALSAIMPTAAHAYIGPGAGFGAIAVTLALILGGILLMLGLVWYPLKRMLKGKKAGSAAADAEKASE